VKEFPTLANVRALKEFLSYYRQFVPDFIKEAGPLHMLTRANVAFVWSESCQEAFRWMEELLASPPVLAYPDFSNHFESIPRTRAC